MDLAKGLTLTGQDNPSQHFATERAEAIRSRSPELVKQELWGLAVTYNLVRQEMARIAADLGSRP